MGDTKYYTVREVADLLRVSEVSIRRYIRDGKLTAVKVGSNVRISESAVATFVRK